MATEHIGCGSVRVTASGMEWWCVQRACNGTNHYFLRPRFIQSPSTPGLAEVDLDG